MPFWSRLPLALTLGAALCLAPPAGHAASATVQVSVEVPAGKTRSVRVSNLPRGAIVSVRVEANARLAVALVSAAQLKSKEPQALFRGVLDRSMSFQLGVPEAGHYYLVLDNRRGDEAVKAKATVRAEKPAATPAGKEPLDKT
jgi:hypothetical protein